jgi:hypothetical protein
VWRRCDAQGQLPAGAFLPGRKKPREAGLRFPTRNVGSFAMQPVLPPARVAAHAPAWSPKHASWSPKWSRTVKTVIVWPPPTTKRPTYPPPFSTFDGKASDGSPLGMAKALPLLKATAHSAAAPASEYLRFFSMGFPLTVISCRTLFPCLWFQRTPAATFFYEYSFTSISSRTASGKRGTELAEPHTGMHSPRSAEGAEYGRTRGLATSPSMRQGTTQRWFTASIAMRGRD